ncbi:hypothetical protein WJX72_007916 [[Myrmecia] bisecta]|uniref:F-box domain-containing protein n=1 Tax=[Myrmecia] bisecta TaxID=41462 RepID=A0AAW1R754_9CHLO
MEALIDTLSDELVCEILHHLPTRDKQRSAQLVCKRWHNLLKHPHSPGLWGTVTWDLDQLSQAGASPEVMDDNLSRDDDRVLASLEWLGFRVKGIAALRVVVNTSNRGLNQALRYLPALFGSMVTKEWFPKLVLWVKGDRGEDFLGSEMFTAAAFMDILVPSLESLQIDFGEAWAEHTAQLEQIAQLTGLSTLILDVKDNKPPVYGS